MRQTKWMLALGVAATLALTGCPGEEGGGGGEVTYDESNPVTREEQTTRTPVMGAEPGERSQPGVGTGYSEGESTVIAEGGEPLIKVDVNSASVDELMKVPGISYDLAQAIVQNRPFSSPQDMADRIPNLSENYVQSFDQYLEFGGTGGG